MKHIINVGFYILCDKHKKTGCRLCMEEEVFYRGYSNSIKFSRFCKLIVYDDKTKKIETIKRLVKE